MNARVRILAVAAAALGGLAAAAATGTGASLLFPAARADAVDDAIKAFEEYLKTNPDSQGIRNQVAELSLRKDPRVGDALLPLLRHKDDDVKIAVAQNIGKQGNAKVVAYLKAMADHKDADEKPKVLAALLEGIGDGDAKRNYDYLMKIAKKQLDYNADIACAAFRAAANYVTVDTVEDLVKELARADYTTTADNPVKRAARGATKPVLLDLLKKVTGEEINDVKIWNEWWSRNKKSWKPPLPGQEARKDLNASDSFRDEAYGFEITKPSRAWMFRKPEGTQPYLILEALDEGQRAAWVELTCVGTKNYKSKTPDAWAEEMKGGLEGKFRDFKEADWTRKGRIGGENSVEQVLFGQHKDFDAVYMHNAYVEKGQVMYQFLCIWKSGKSAALKDDIGQILRDFKLFR